MSANLGPDNEGVKSEVDLQKIANGTVKSETLHQLQYHDDSRTKKLPLESIKDVAAAALNQSEALLTKWFPKGRVIGGEFHVGSLDGEPGDSLKINIKTGKGADFSTGEQGFADLVSLRRAILGCESMSEAAHDVAEQIGYTIAGIGKKRRPLKTQPSLPGVSKKPGQAHVSENEWGALELVPANAPQPGGTHSSLGQPTAAYKYCNLKGEHLFTVCRYETADGKQFRPFTWCRNPENGEEQWRNKGYPFPQPLYGVERLRENPSAPVLITEGEKCSEIAQRLLPDYVVLTWAGGANAFGKTDFSTLAGRNVVLWPNNDEPGRTAMRGVAAKLIEIGAALIGMVSVPSNSPEKWDVADAVQEGWSVEQVRELIQGALALPGVNPNTLEETLCEIVDILKRFVVFSTDAPYLTLALHVAHTYALDAFEYTPYIHLFSPEKRCGKSRVLEVLSHLVARPWGFINPSEAVLFRKIEQDRPTILWDEIDTVFSGRTTDPSKENLRGLLNLGFKSGAKIPRCEGQTHEVRDFSVFCPKVIAGIGQLPDTISDRCIQLRLERKKKSQLTERFRSREAVEITEPLRSKLEAWAANPQVIERLRNARPDIPHEFGDRQADISEPLLAIADLAGGEWPQLARKALLELFHAADAVNDSYRVALLRDIKAIFDETGLKRISTKFLLESLVKRGGQWAERWNRDLISGNVNGPAAKLGSLLREFGIASRTLVFPEEPDAKGYLESAFIDIWDRYL